MTETWREIRYVEFQADVAISGDRCLWCPMVTADDVKVDFFVPAEGDRVPGFVRIFKREDKD